MNLFKKLFGIKEKKRNQPDVDDILDEFFPDRHLREEQENKKYEIENEDDNTPSILKNFRDINRGKKVNDLAQQYFDILQKLLAADKSGDYKKLLMHCQASLSLIEPLIIQEKMFGDEFRIKSIPAIEKGLVYFAIFKNIGQIKNIEDIINYFSELSKFKPLVEEAYKRRDVASILTKIISDNPGIKQTELKSHFEGIEPSFIYNTVYYMDKVGIINKGKEGKSVILFPK